MKRFKRVLAGVLSLVLGGAAFYLALVFYRASRNLIPLTGELHAQDYALFLALGALGVAFLAIAYVYLVRTPRA